MTFFQQWCLLLDEKFDIFIFLQLNLHQRTTWPLTATFTASNFPRQNIFLYGLFWVIWRWLRPPGNTGGLPSWWQSHLARKVWWGFTKYLHTAKSLRNIQVTLQMIKRKSKLRIHVVHEKLVRCTLKIFHYFMSPSLAPPHSLPLTQYLREKIGPGRPPPWLGNINDGGS